MKLKAYDIDIYKLPNKAHEYQYNIRQDFFKHFENSLISEGKLQADITLDKQERLIVLKFHIYGTVELECDRSLEKFDYPLDTKEQIILQYGAEEQELSEELAVITRNTQRINVAQYIYEFIGLSIPMKKLHPRYEDNDSPFAEGEIVYSSGAANQQEDDTKDQLDPRWDILKKLKN